MASGSLVPDASRTRVEIPGHPLELGRKFNQRLAGVQIGALGCELVAVARALMEHLGVHKLARSLIWDKCRPRRDVPSKNER